MVMAVSFTRYGRLYYLDPGPHSPKVGDKVLVPTDAGPEVAECVWPPQWVSEDIEGLPVCAGLATEEHLARDEANRRRLLERGKTSGRADDNAESIRKRFRTFVETSMPVVDHYEKENRVVKVNATDTPDGVYADTQARLRKVLGDKF